METDREETGVGGASEDPKPLQHQLLRPLNPLTERFKSEFFRKIPEEPGVYFFKDERGEILYVGKAKNLRKRVSSYKQIRTGKSSRKLCRLVFHTHKIDWQICPDEEEALLTENHFLSTLKPEYNRMNTVPEYYWYLNLKIEKGAITLAFNYHADPEGETFGAFKSKNHNRESLKRVLWLFDFLEANRKDYVTPYSLTVDSDGFRLPYQSKRSVKLLSHFLNGRSTKLLESAEKRLHKKPPECSFTKFRLEHALEEALEFFEGPLRRIFEMKKIEGLKSHIPKEDLDDLLVRSRS